MPSVYLVAAFGFPVVEIPAESPEAAEAIYRRVYKQAEALRVFVSPVGMSPAA